MRVLLDTSTFIWAVDSPDLISKAAMRVLEDGETIRELSAISLVEIAIKANYGNLKLSREDVLAGLDELQARVLPFGAEHASRLFGLPLHHRDPFDRQLIAQALAEGIPVVTSDKVFRKYGVKVIW
jgi:PIN domain nuclease of toxin-antitoxin system